MPPGATVAYPLTFRPPAPGEHRGTLELTIPNTGGCDFHHCAQLLGPAASCTFAGQQGIR